MYTIDLDYLTTDEQTALLQSELMKHFHAVVLVYDVAQRRTVRLLQSLVEQCALTDTEIRLCAAVNATADDQVR